MEKYGKCSRFSGRLQPGWGLHVYLMSREKRGISLSIPECIKTDRLGISLTDRNNRRYPAGGSIFGLGVVRLTVKGLAARPSGDFKENPESRFIK